jgi:integrase
VRVQLAPKTCEVYKHTLAHLRAFVDGHRLVSTLTTWEIDQYKIHRSRLVKPSTVNIELRSLKSFFNTLKRWEMIHKDPCEGVALVRFPEQPPRYLPKDEIPVLIDAIQEQWLKDIVLFALMSGARLGEILNLRWEDVDLPNRTARIQSRHAYRVKGGKVRTVPLNVTLTEILSSRATREGIVFTGKRGKQVDSNYVSQKFREIVRSLGFDRGIHFHSLRHTFASLLVKSGVSLYKVQKLLGHSSSRVTEMYAYLQPSEMHDVVSLLSI